MGGFARRDGLRVGYDVLAALREWNDAGVWTRLHQVLLDELHEAGEVDWSRAVADSSHVRAKGGAN
jgi:hypothetical protein